MRGHVDAGSSDREGRSASEITDGRRLLGKSFGDFGELLSETKLTAVAGNELVGICRLSGLLRLIRKLRSRAFLISTNKEIEL